MKDRWSDADARRIVSSYAKQGVGPDVALRVYSSRLLGADRRLVLHGGGNTSVKTTLPDLYGDAVEVICVKGSGWDLATIEPEGLPAVRLEPLRRMRQLGALSDEAMVNAQRINLLDAKAPNPSVETLLHAFLPHRVVDHTHANAILALTDQTEGEVVCREVFGARVGYVPYIMPGFALAKQAVEVFEQDESIEGLLLLKHGLFTFGDSAKEAYRRMIALVSLAEAAISQRGTRPLRAASAPTTVASVSAVAPILRGLTALSDGDDYTRFILEHRASPDILTYVNGAELERYSQQGTVTPDHVIRTKSKPLIVPAPEPEALDRFGIAVRDALSAYAKDYHEYFVRHNSTQSVAKAELDPMPRVILVPGVGLFGLGRSRRAAKIAADLAETNVAVIGDAESMGEYEVIEESDIYDIEYWSLEQAKLAGAVSRQLDGHVAVVTGGGSGIGAAIVRRLAQEGAEVMVLDREGDAATAVAEECGGTGFVCDVTEPSQVRAVFESIVALVGGVDIVVSNAGAAWQGRVGEVPAEDLRASFELNFFAHQTVAQAAVAIMKAQEIGGCLLFNASKQAVNPGKHFGPYGLPKSATLSLMRQYAVDYGEVGIRSNAVNADRVRSGLLSASMIQQRATQRGVSPAEYMEGNLLGREVSASDVAQAFLHLALAMKTTGAVMTVDGGNIAAALR